MKDIEIIREIETWFRARNSIKIKNKILVIYTLRERECSSWPKEILVKTVRTDVETRLVE